MSPAEGRKFGLTVGGAFLAIAALLWWRGRLGAVPYVGGIGALLALAGLLVPAHLGPVQRAWMGLAHLLSKVTTPIFMGVVFYLVMTPIGLVMRMFGHAPLRHVAPGGGHWMPRPTAPEARSSMERQF